jgi:RimJ/RimL family protein N-acetyltransferase
MKRSRVRRAGLGASLAAMNALHRDDSIPASGFGIPPSARHGRSRWPCGDGGAERTMVLAAPLGASEWAMIRAFIGKTDRDDLRMRFGQWLDFHSEPILKRFFDVGDNSGELVWALDENGDISGILHRVLISPCEAEIGLIVRSDLKRTGIGETLLRTALARALRQNLKTLRALVLGENRAMLRLARKIGAVPRQSAGLSVELEFDLSQICTGAMVPLLAAAATTNPPTSALS